MARLAKKEETHGYIVGVLNLQSTSTPYRPLKTMYFKRGKITLDQAPLGAGATLVKLVRNYDTTDVIYEASFAEGVSSINLTTEAQLAEGDLMSLVVSSVCANFAGADLILSLEYHN